MRIHRVLACGLAVAVSACAGGGFRAGEDIAGLRYAAVPAAPVPIAAWSRLGDPAGPVRVYIEGDGRAYGPTGQPSTDPTPRDGLALRLALADPSANVVYLARPCQYLRTPACAKPLWSSARFSEPMVAALGQALDALVGGRELHLVGYSGGAAVAVALAARRDDVASLRTVAGNLDPPAVNRHHRATERLDAVDVAAALRAAARIPQVHFMGEDDRIVPPELAQAAIARIPDRRCVAVRRVEASHADGWAERWRQLLEYTPACG